ncbi:hypothetical protein [Streptomyces sp. NPDC089919]|uniref:hypothetical protein n=1 Tax=Streptomyces sp. NPDC089919 TaxID=3155188 RepID=UPI00343FCEE8
MVTIAAFVGALLFGGLVLALALTSLGTLLGAFMLLVCGVVFACLWVIPGRPRQWGLAWFDQLLARTLEGLIATLVLGSVLIVQVACTRMFDPYGWLPTTGLSIAAAVVGMRFRAVVAQIIGVTGTSAGAVGGFLIAGALGRGRARRKEGADTPPHPRAASRHAPAASPDPAGPDTLSPPRVPPVRAMAPPPLPGGAGGVLPVRAAVPPASTPAGFGRAITGTPAPFAPATPGLATAAATPARAAAVHDAPAAPPQPAALRPERRAAPSPVSFRQAPPPLAELFEEARP